MAAGNVGVLPIRPDGALADAVEVVTLPGQPGPHRIEQLSSHPHHVVFDPGGRSMIVPDKGLDRVFVFRFDAGTGKLTSTEQGAAVARAGSAHAMQHSIPACPSRGWSMRSPAPLRRTFGTRSAAVFGPYRFCPRCHPTTPVRTPRRRLGTAGGRFVYCSNRGHDRIATFTSDTRTGLLTSAGWTPSRGRTPHYIGFDPSHSFLCATNEQSDTVVTHRADAATGRLAITGSPVHNASPVSIAFAVLPA